MTNWPVGVLILDKKRKCRYANHTILSLLAGSKSQIVDQPLSNIEKYLPLTQAITQLQNQNLTSLLTEVTVHEKVFELTVTKVENDEVMVMCREITSWRDTRDSFVSYVSHELKNPLAVITGFTQLLERKLKATADEKALDYVNKISNKATYLEMLVNQAADEFRLKTSSYRVKAEPLDFVSMTKEVVTAFQALNPDVIIKVETESDHSMVAADSKKLYQLLANVINTAVMVNRSTQPLILAISSTTNHMVLQINTLHPLTEDEATALFRSFTHTDEVLEFIPLGLNTGLYASAQLAKAHGGQVYIEIDGSQTTFVIEIPRA